MKKEKALPTEEIIGGQAVMEGVMMLNGNKQAIAVRNPKGKIVVKKGTIRSPKSVIFKTPLIRGFFKLMYMMIIGIRAMTYSTSIAIEEEEEKIEGWGMVGFMFLSVAFALLLFKFLPLLITKFFVSKIDFLSNSNIWPNVVDGVIKILIMILYIYLISLAKDTKRVFEYHGAEHKVVRCNEAKEKLTVKNARKFSRYHPRCGTAFIFGALMISILIYTVIPFNSTTFWQNLGLRILLLPLVMGVSYEVLRLSGKNENNIFFKAITAPGMWMQRLTTKEPDSKQLEVAIRSLKATL
ncbi:MAG: DUF1385 domain-containing protein [Nanoarchaeota archaeon]|jgi:uncharacterized protein YqhQ|nr:DUF1385 domain-containing protein [Nanoarchaeota archaeon]